MCKWLGLQMVQGAHGAGLRFWATLNCRKHVRLFQRLTATVLRSLLALFLGLFHPIGEQCGLHRLDRSCCGLGLVIEGISGGLQSFHVLSFACRGRSSQKPFEVCSCLNKTSPPQPLGCTACEELVGGSGHGCFDLF